MSKKELGAFYTKNTEEVFGEYKDLFNEKSVIDPFCGEKFLLNYAQLHGAASVRGIDINPKVNPDKINNSLLNPIKLEGFIFTNPPYLLNNKTPNKEVFVKWGVDDLYKASLKMLSQFSDEGVVVVPQNLFLDEDWAFRKYLFSVWEISHVVWHENVVFDDTNVRVVCFHYKPGKTVELFNELLIDDCTHKLRPGNAWWCIQKEGYQRAVKIKRVIKGKKYSNLRSLVLRTTDTGKSGGEIKLYVGEPYYGKTSDRNLASFAFESEKSDEEICYLFNSTIHRMRLQYGDKILTNFLQSKSSVRKRISFAQAVNVIKYVIE